ncbi:metallophosphoesterase [Massilia sp. W12]|uniref:metallophosphoesterase n=1 Tax=Massilia sp. W12 TaxID=3126507 RepID=UPI0030D4AE6D
MKMPSQQDHPPLYVLSDLHLAPRSEALSFHSHAALVGLLEYMRAQAQPVRLILNGDVFDFLQLPDYDTLSLPMAAPRMSAILDALDKEDAAHNIVQALRRFTQAGHILHCQPGNHDPELHWHSVQEVLQARLGASPPLPYNLACWSVQAYGHQVQGMHGHWQDPFNAISAETMGKAEADGDASVKLPPGSNMVLQVINPYRRARDAQGRKRFPFIDGMPTEMAVIFSLLYLDPKLAWKRIQTALGLGAQALLRRLALYLRPAHLLTEESQAIDENPVLKQLADDLFMRMTPTERIPQNTDMICQEIETYLQGAQAAPNTLAASDGWFGRLLLRALAHEISQAQAVQDAACQDALAVDSITTWGRHPSGPMIAITGHTHAPKQIQYVGGLYLNSGSWQDSYALPQDLTEEGVKQWLQDLQQAKLPALRRCPVLRVDEAGAGLLEWDGTGLRAW